MMSWEGIDRILFFIALTAYLVAACLAAGQLYRQTRLLKQALNVTVGFGVITNGLAIVMRTIASGHSPFADMYEFGIVLVFITVVLTNFFERRYKAYNLHAFVLPLIVILASTVIISYHPSRPLVPALRSHWLIIHVASAAIAYGTLAVACAIATMYLCKKRLVQNGADSEALLLPALERLDVIASQLVSLAMPFLTLLIITGAIWAEYAWGSYWQWDPKETWSLITWVNYAIYLHGRRVLGWRDEKAMWLLVMGFIAILITFVGINLLKRGLHAYF